ncbi:MAG: hypothetical protein P8Y05_13565 [Deinococcales bacterium]
MNGRRTRNLALLGLALALVLVGCAPAASRRAAPTVAVLNGPAEGRIAGSAARLEADMRTQGPLYFSFVSSAAMRFAEGHSDLFHDRAVTAAGRIARSYDAPYAVLIGASSLDRQVTVSKGKSARTVSVTLRIEAVVVDAAMARFDSPLCQQTRTESTADALPPLQQDPTVQALRNEGVHDVAAAVVGALWHALGIHPSPRAP